MDAGFGATSYTVFRAISVTGFDATAIGSVTAANDTDTGLTTVLRTSTPLWLLGPTEACRVPLMRQRQRRSLRHRWRRSPWPLPRGNRGDRAVLERERRRIDLQSVPGIGCRRGRSCTYRRRINRDYLQGYRPECRYGVLRVASVNGGGPSPASTEANAP